ncbi:MAG: SDR family oxidoreductase [Candidatus Atribacteria bacterium]|nr:SDR family oxidoreductase [Candidatus Atribacteria bacterium]
MELGLKDKVAFVMAGSKGLGKGVATKLAEEGAQVVITSRNIENLRQAQEEIKNITGREVLIIPMDATKKDDIQKAVDETIKKFGTIHILFANSGGPPPGTFFDVKPEDYLSAINLNLMSTIYAVYAVIPYMMKQNWGRIIASTSMTVKQPLDSLILSNVSRIGVVSFIKSVSNVVAPYGITANCVAPAYTMTERIKHLVEAQVKKEGVSEEVAQKSMIKDIPMGRMGTVEEFASTVAFLASENASFITGILLPIDGGYVKGI